MKFDERTLVKELLAKNSKELTKDEKFLREFILAESGHKWYSLVFEIRALLAMYDYVKNIHGEKFALKCLATDNGEVLMLLKSFNEKKKKEVCEPFTPLSDEKLTELEYLMTNFTANHARKNLMLLSALPFLAGLTTGSTFLRSTGSGLLYYSIYRLLRKGKLRMSERKQELKQYAVKALDCMSLLAPYFISSMLQYAKNSSLHDILLSVVMISLFQLSYRVGTSQVIKKQYSIWKRLPEKLRKAYWILYNSMNDHIRAGKIVVDPLRDGGNFIRRTVSKREVKERIEEYLNYLEERGLISQREKTLVEERIDEDYIKLIPDDGIPREAHPSIRGYLEKMIVAKREDGRFTINKRFIEVFKRMLLNQPTYREYIAKRLIEDGISKRIVNYVIHGKGLSFRERFTHGEEIKECENKLNSYVGKIILQGCKQSYFYPLYTIEGSNVIKTYNEYFVGILNDSGFYLDGIIAKEIWRLVMHIRATTGLSYMERKEHLNQSNPLQLPRWH